MITLTHGQTLTVTDGRRPPFAARVFVRDQWFAQIGSIHLADPAASGTAEAFIVPLPAVIGLAALGAPEPVEVATGDVLRVEGAGYEWVLMPATAQRGPRLVAA